MSPQTSTVNSTTSPRRRQPGIGRTPNARSHPTLGRAIWLYHVDALAWYVPRHTDLDVVLPRPGRSPSCSGPPHSRRRIGLHKAIGTAPRCRFLSTRPPASLLHPPTIKPVRVGRRSYSVVVARPTSPKHPSYGRGPAPCVSNTDSPQLIALAAGKIGGKSMLVSLPYGDQQSWIRPIRELLLLPIRVHAPSILSSAICVEEEHRRLNP